MYRLHLHHADWPCREVNPWVGPLCDLQIQPFTWQGLSPPYSPLSNSKESALINNTSNTTISGVFSVIFPIPRESFGQQSWPVWCHLGALARFPISSSTHRTCWSPVATMKKITERHTEVRLTCFTVTSHEANGAAAVVAVVDDAAGSVIQTWLTGHTFIDLDLAVSTWDQEQQA